MAYQTSVRELADFLLRKFQHPNYDHNFAAPSVYVMTERDMHDTLDNLQIEKDKARRTELLSELEGQVLILHTVSYYGDKERDHIIDKIERLRKEL